jgi:hypothetical protein
MIDYLEKFYPMRRLFLALVFSALVSTVLSSQHVLYSDFYTGFHTYSLDERRGNNIINSDDYLGNNLQIDSINNVFLLTRGDQFILYKIDGNQPKNIATIRSIDYENYVISPLEKSIYYIYDNWMFRLTYEGKRDTIIKRIANVTLKDLCIDPIKKKLYFNKNLNAFSSLIQCDYNGTNQKTIYSYNEDLDLYDMQFDVKHNRMFYLYWEDMSKIGALNLSDKSFKEVLRQEYGSVLEFHFDENKEELYFVNTRNKNIEKKNIKTGVISLVKRTNPAEVMDLTLYNNQLIWMENRNNNDREYYIGHLTDVDYKELFYKDHTVPYSFDFNSKTNKIIGRTNFNQVVSSDINGDNFHLHTDRGMDSPAEILYHKDKLYYLVNNYHFLASSNKDGSDYKIIKNFTGLSAVSAVIDDRTDYIYYVNEYNKSIERVKTDGTGFETFWLSTDIDPNFAYISIDKDNNQLIVTERDCKCIFTLNLETKTKKILKAGTITTFYPEEFVYNSKNKFIYIKDSWNKKIYRMKIDGSEFTTLKSNNTGAYISHYDQVENKMYGIRGDSATIVEFDENANKINSIATNFGKKISVRFAKEPGKGIFYFIDVDVNITKKIYSIDISSLEIKNILNNYSNPYEDLNKFTIDNQNNIFYEYADYSGLLIETKLDSDSTYYYNDWPTGLLGMDLIESTNEFVAYTDKAILKFSKEGILLDTLVKAGSVGFVSRNFNSLSYNKMDNRIYFIDYGQKQIRSVSETGDNINTHYTFATNTSTANKIKFDKAGKMYITINKNNLVRLNENQTNDTFYLPGLVLRGNIVILDSLPIIDADGDGLTFDKDCNDNQAITTEIANNGIDEDCDGMDLIIDEDGDGFNSSMDCDDQNIVVNPYAAEVPYNGIDEDCNTYTLDDDLDGDGFPIATDCNDTNSLINPNVFEQIYNGIDDDCNPLTIDNDLDGDGFDYPTDCNDNNALINPNVQEIPYNNLNDDCSLDTPDDDLDDDGFIAAMDCNDTLATINPSALEIPDNNVDDNCDGEIDEISSSIDEHKFTIALFPNPSKDIVQVISDGVIDNMNIISATGMIIFGTKNPIIDVSGLSPGLYFLEVILNTGGSKKLKFIVI